MGASAPLQAGAPLPASWSGPVRNDSGSNGVGGIANIVFASCACSEAADALASATPSTHDIIRTREETPIRKSDYTSSEK
jgi:hypothetical protein